MTQKKVKASVHCLEKGRFSDRAAKKRQNHCALLGGVLLALSALVFR